MAHSFARIRRRLAVVGAIAAALLLAGCGVKGPLEPPPATAAAGAEMKAGISPPPVATGPIDRRRERALRGLGTPSKPDDEFALDPLL
ncbi:MAG TPA: lipoprotein [Xanthobacteraceae bacterium]|nr:lipoprotein [Xanthobacteraceae bacterium]